MLVRPCCRHRSSQVLARTCFPDTGTPPERSPDPGAHAKVMSLCWLLHPNVQGLVALLSPLTVACLEHADTVRPCLDCQPPLASRDPARSRQAKMRSRQAKMRGKALEPKSSS